ncbi:MAG TPA: glycosyltransferase family A protein [Thermodesulfobacteriota bacterium]|nr:glycosyltransferase family A protein [Thermodesulfobacteriota bacterium]
MDIRTPVLKAAYRIFPFSLKGDADVGDARPGCEVSCVINFYKRTDLLRVILACLSEQDLGRERFEVVLVEDRGGTPEGKAAADEFSGALDIRYHTLEDGFGVMGYSRNYGLSKTGGRYVLFLDDDTVILDGGFLTSLVQEFESTGADAIMPRGSASYSIIEGRYSFHDPYFPTNRCMAYRRETLRDLSGFVSGIIGQEDVELAVRLAASGKNALKSERLSYMHPPLVTTGTGKAAAVGLSFAKLRGRYPLPVWLMLLANGSRYLPLLVVPFNTRCRMQGRFSLGFLKGVWYSFTGRKIDYN